MTREETLKLLMVMAASYPNARITNAEQMADAWQMVFGEYPAEQIYKAARLHMQTSKFFPTPADIMEKIQRAAIVFNNATPPALQAPKKARAFQIPEGMTENEFLDLFIESQIEFETEMERRKTT